MSLDATRWAWEQSGMRAAEKLVLLALADRADENHCCYPSIARLVSDTCLDRKAIFSAVASLESRELISVSREFGASNKYRLIGVPDRHKSSTENGTGKRRTTGTQNGTGSATPAAETSTESGTALDDETGTENGTGEAESSTESGTRPENGTSTENGTRPVPKAVLEPVPKTGHEPTNEPTKNLKPLNPSAAEGLVVPPENTLPAAAENRVDGYRRKFRMFADWKPDPKLLTEYLWRAGVVESPVNPAALANFTNYQSGEQSVHTEAQWIGKLVTSAQQYNLRNPSGDNPNAIGQRNPRTPAEHKLAAIRATVDYDAATNF